LQRRESRGEKPRVLFGKPYTNLVSRGHHRRLIVLRREKEEQLRKKKGNLNSFPQRKRSQGGEEAQTPKEILTNVRTFISLKKKRKTSIEKETSTFGKRKRAGHAKAQVFRVTGKLIAVTSAKKKTRM